VGKSNGILSKNLGDKVFQDIKDQEEEKNP
jgi:hypothetical protein